jgi:hypothetical protein
LDEGAVLQPPLSHIHWDRGQLTQRGRLPAGSRKLCAREQPRPPSTPPSPPLPQLLLAESLNDGGYRLRVAQFLRAWVTGKVCGCVHARRGVFITACSWLLVARHIQGRQPLTELAPAASRPHRPPAGARMTTPTVSCLSPAAAWPTSPPTPSAARPSHCRTPPAQRCWRCCMRGRAPRSAKARATGSSALHLGR